ncbi:MAG: SCO family protein [Neisseria sp.]|nr:SCO family protein [Neisseria sp.]
MTDKLFYTAVLLAFLCACSPDSQTIKPQNPVPAAETAPAFNGSDVRSDNIGGDFVLTDGKGQTFGLSRLQGKAVILSFGYTHCPDICPLTLQTYNDVLAELGEAAKDVAVVFVSIDPDRDTPELIGRYAEQFHPDFIGLTAAGGQNIEKIKQQYRVMSAKAKQISEKVYLVDHSAGTYLLDKNGKTAVFEPYGSEAAQIAEDIRILLK